MKKMDKKLVKFIKKVKDVHGDNVDTSKVMYVDSKTKVCLICPKHGEYWQAPAACVRGHKCPKCSNENRGPKSENRMTTEKFIIEANKTHNGKFDYSQSVYVNSDTKIDIICPIHGVFSQLPYGHLNGQGCPKCAGRELNTKDIINKFREIHGEQYDYSKVIYEKAKDKVCIICPEHGEFMQTPQKHITGQGCPKCAKLKQSKSQTLTNEQFVQKAVQIYGNYYDYSQVNYSDSHNKVCIICPKHGEFWQRPNDHLCGHGCNKCGQLVSNAEDEIANLLRSYNPQRHNRILLKGKEIDIYLRDLKLGIEYNGLHWHSEEFEKDEKYHVRKLEECEKQGIRLIHIFEDEWLYKNEIVKSRLLNIVGATPNRVYARQCIIKEVSQPIASSFLDENHLQGRCNALYRYGLYYKDELVSLMTFGKLRKNLGSNSKDGHYELLRFCNKINTNVVGGASRLFKYFITRINPTKVISYADRRWSCGNLYEQLGFILSHTSEPSYFYVVDDKRENRFKYRKDILVKEGFDASKSEHQIMLERGIYRIYDCGCLCYEWFDKDNNVEQV